ncbi:MAG: hypothetical protein MZW92_48000 [Comamonadaceae bacterium]|nr:hypothetical protein [Comamonadaceae bacterium]
MPRTSPKPAEAEADWINKGADCARPRRVRGAGTPPATAVCRPYRPAAQCRSRIAGLAAPTRGASDAPVPPQSLYALIGDFGRRHRRAYLLSALMLVGVAVLTVWMPRQVGQHRRRAGRRAACTAARCWRELRPAAGDGRGHLPAARRLAAASCSPRPTGSASSCARGCTTRLSHAGAAVLPDAAAPAT